MSNCLFFKSAAAAQEFGLRPCLRCRPESAPFGGAWRGTSSTVSRALARISSGKLDGKDTCVAQFAESLGVGERQLRRLFKEHVGASPIQVAKTRRILLAKQLLHESHLSIGEVALAAGFGSARRLNEAFQKSHQRSPSAWRRKSRAIPLGENAVQNESLKLHLRYATPFCWESLLSHFQLRAIDDVERVTPESYSRSFSIDGFDGTLEIRHCPDLDSVELSLNLPTLEILPEIISRVRSLFDLDTDVRAIGEVLSVDALLAPLIEARPGLRVAGAWTGFELAMRAVLGQQISVEAGRRLTSQLVAICGQKLSERQQKPGLQKTFPRAEQVAKADLSSLKMPNARRQTLHQVAMATLAEPTLFESLHTPEETVARLRRIPGIGDWTAQYIALRAAREPDAFPAADVGILRGATTPGGPRPTSKAMLERATQWRPWRGYAAQHLWNASATKGSS